MLHGETVHSPLPMDLPWWMPSHFIFFGILYAVIGILGVGIAYCVIKSWLDAKKEVKGF